MPSPSPLSAAALSSSASSSEPVQAATASRGCHAAGGDRRAAMNAPCQVGHGPLCCRGARPPGGPLQCAPPAWRGRRAACRRVYGPCSAAFTSASQGSSRAAKRSGCSRWALCRRLHQRRPCVGADGRRGAPGDGGVAMVVGAGYHQHRHVDGRQHVPQRPLRARCPASSRLVARPRRCCGAALPRTGPGGRPANMGMASQCSTKRRRPRPGCAGPGPGRRRGVRPARRGPRCPGCRPRAPAHAPPRGPR